MKLTILHLSDIHISESSVLPASDQVAAVLREAEERPSYVLILVTGDISFSGKKLQYEKAASFLQSLSTEIIKNTSSKCSTVVIPGNHDCAFPADSSVRDLVLDKVRTSRGECESEAYLRTCLGVQDEFFHWAAATKIFSLEQDKARLAWRTEIDLGDAKTLSVLSCNTAWMSSLHEQQGHLSFPLGALPAVPPADLVLAALHHPYNWFEATNSRDLMHAIEASADIVLTGHEHEGAAFTKQINKGPNVHYVEGQVLSEPNDPFSGFNVVNVDLVKNEFQLLLYAWDGERYATERTTSPWQPFVKNARSTTTPIDLTDEMQRFLRDPGAQLTHRAKELQLDDIFVPPNLRRFVRVKGEEGVYREIIESDYVANRLFENRRVHFSGPAQCGKTAFAKMLYKYAADRQLTPLIIPGDKLDHCDPKYLNRIVRNEFAKQYKRPEVDAYLQLPKEIKVAIIDDFSDSPLNQQARALACAWFAERFDYIFLFGGDLSQIEELVLDKDAAKGFSGFVYYEIMEFGFLLRERLIEKWLSIGRDHTVERQQLAHEVYQAERLVDTVLGKNLVPSYPIFVLVLLQQIETHTAVDTRSGAYGYFYDVMITAALNRTSSSPDDVDAKYTYLAELAWHLFQHKTRELDKEEFTSFNNSHWTKYRLTADLGTFQSELETARMLLHFDAGIRFNYRYLYYYFVARYMRDNMSDAATQTGINEIVQNLQREDCANVIIFLTYLSKDRPMIMKVLEAARSIFSDIPPCDLESHVEFLNRLQNRAPEIMLPEGDATDRRKEVLRHMDNMVEEDDQETPETMGQSEEEKKQIRDILSLNKGVKSLQIMGQILRNFSGSLPGDLKAALATECFSIGLRMLNMIYRAFETNLDGTLATLADIICKKLNNLPETDRPRVAKQFLFFLTEMLCFSMMKRVSIAVGSDRLIPTYEDVRRVYDNCATELVQTLIRLDHCKSFPEKKIKELKDKFQANIFASTLLRVMVADHFYLFPRPQRVQQHVCAMLGMKQTPRMVVAGSARKRKA